MPREPVLSREAFYTTNADGSIRLLDWYLVNTAIGGMVEPRSIMNVDSDGRLGPVDVIDAGWTRLSAFNEDTFYTHFGLNGQQIFLDRSR